MSNARTTPAVGARTASVLQGILDQRIMESFPGLTNEQAKWLRTYRPAKCYDPSVETLEEHLLYAGEHRLAMSLLEEHSLQARASDPHDSIFEAEDAEKAGDA